MQQTKATRMLSIILLSGLVIRLLVLFTQGWTALPGVGGDELWYLVNGQGMWSSDPTGIALGYPFAVNNLGVAPLYLVFNGLIQLIFGYIPALGIIRLLQILMTVLICYFAYDLARLLTEDVRAGWVAAAMLAFSVTWIVEPLLIHTETLYITLLIAAIWCYCRWILPSLETVHPLLMISVGLLFGLATLTRAAGILFPAGIAIHIILVAGRQHWQRGIQIALIILISYSATISTWTVYNVVRYDRFVIVSNQFFPTLWRGATDADGTPSQNDELLGEQTAMEQSSEIITGDPATYLALRLRELSGAYLQPHGTLSFQGDSLKAIVFDLFQNGITLTGLQQMLNTDGFFPKLLIYIWHYSALAGGIIGMWLTRQQWQVSLVFIGFIGYTTLLHFVLQALPRYIFPTYVFYVVFASVTIVALWDVRGDNKKEAE